MSRSTRDRPAKSPLSEAAVVDAALSILKSEGLDAVTMRRVATALDTGPASLYVYVANREALLRAVQDRITADIALEPVDPSRWRAQLHALLVRMHAALVAHPGIAAAALAEPPATEAALQLTENLMGLLLAAGLTPQDAAWAVDILAALVTHAAIEDNLRRTDPPTLAADLRSLFLSLPPARFPLLTAHAAPLTAGDSATRFHFALDVVLDGLLARTLVRNSESPSGDGL